MPSFKTFKNKMLNAKNATAASKKKKLRKKKLKS